MITLQDGRTLIGGGGVPYAISDAYQNPWWWLPDISVTPEVGISTEKVWSINLTSGTITTLRDFKTAPNSATLPNVGPKSI